MDIYGINILIKLSHKTKGNLVNILTKKQHILKRLEFEQFYIFKKFLNIIIINYFKH